MPNKATYRKHVMNGATVTVIEEDETGNALRAFGSAVPSDSGAGYAPACVFQQTDAASAITTVYVNIGSSTSCNFDSINDASSIAAAGFTIPTSQTLAVTTADLLTVGGIIVPQHLEIMFNGTQTASATDAPLFIANRAYQVTNVTQIHSVAAGGASKLQLTKDTGTDAPGAGTDLLTNNTNTGFDLNATANTLQTGTLTATTADLQLATGNRLSLDWANAIQSSATICVCVSLKRI